MVKLDLALDRRIPLAFPGVIPLDPPVDALAGLQFLAWKGTGQAAEGRDGLGVVAGFALAAELLEAPEAEAAARLEALGLECLERSGGGRPAVTARHLVRSAAGVPRFPPGRYRELAALDPSAAGGRIVLAGDYLASPSIEGAVRTGLAAAERVIAALGDAR